MIGVMNFDHETGLAVGDHVRKIEGQTRFVGKLLAIYGVPHDDKLWGVFLLDKSEASDHLQHLYPLKQFERI